MDLDRRMFISKVCRASALCTLPGFVGVLQSCGDLGSEGNTSVKEVEVNEAGQIQIDLENAEFSVLKEVGGSVVASAPDFDNVGLLLYRASEASLKAFSRKCTHAGAPVGKFINGVSSCPSHGSRFDTQGEATSGPASESLTQYSVQINGTIVTISK